MNDAGPADDVAASDAAAPLRSRSAHLAAQSTSSAQARDLLRGWCREWGVASAVPAAEMVVTELVENAVRHAEGGAYLTVGLADGSMVISVDDRGVALPRVKHPGPDQPGGRGMQLVDLIAREWGVERQGAGKRVWAAVALS